MIPNIPHLKKYHHHGVAVRSARRHGFMVLIAATPGGLFAMGWLRLRSKGFIRFFESAKKKNI